MRLGRLDGLRTVAIAAVLLHHHTFIHGGWVGVDLFFVLSGFLITGILRRDRNQAHYWKRFYIKRATRILPPVLVFIAVVGIIYRPPVHSLLAYIFFLGNFASTNSWSIWSLGILWSLAVEEHFYLFFPFAVRYVERKALVWTLAGVLIAGAIAAVCGHFAYSSVCRLLFLYVLSSGLSGCGGVACFDGGGGTNESLASAMVGRLWHLARGDVCRVVVQFPAKVRSRGKQHIFNGLGYTLIAAISMFLIAYVLLYPASILSRLLALRPVVFVGTISYGLYLCHTEIRMHIMDATGLSYKRVSPLSVGLSLVLSWLSFRFYEKPIIDWGHRQAARLTGER